MSIQKTLTVYRQTIKDKPILVAEIDGVNGAYVEYQSCRLGRVILNPTPYPMIFVQGKGSSLLFDEDEQKTLTNTTFFVPGERVVKWEAHHRLDFLTLIFSGAWHDRIKSIVSRHKEPLALYEPLLAAIADRIVREMMQQSKNSKDYLSELLSMFVGQLCREIEQSNVAEVPIPKTNNAELVKMVLSHIENHIGDRLLCSELAKVAGLSESHFRLIFKNITGQTPHQYLLSLRLKRAQQLLTTTDMPLSLISSELGFSSQAHMSTAMRKQFGASPLAIREGI